MFRILFFFFSRRLALVTSYNSDPLLESVLRLVAHNVAPFETEGALLVDQTQPIKSVRAY